MFSSSQWGPLVGFSCLQFYISCLYMLSLLSPPLSTEGLFFLLLLFFNICGPLSISPHQPRGLVSPLPSTYPTPIHISKPMTFLMEWLPEDFHKKGSDSPWRRRAFGRTEGKWGNAGGISRQLVLFTISSPVCQSLLLIYSTDGLLVTTAIIMYVYIYTHNA